MGVVLGGSRGRGAGDALSDLDLGLYYRRDARPALSDLRAAASELDPEHGADAVTDYGAWGPRIDGGAWLTVEGQRVDWLYRDLSRVREILAECLAGQVVIDYQPGHPHAFLSHAYLGELRLARVLEDPAGELAALREELATYPRPMRDSIVDQGLWEARFSLDTAASAARRGDVAYVAGSAFRTVALLVQVLHARNERWLINEKGGVAAVASLPIAPAAFGETVTATLAALGTTPDGLGASLGRLRGLCDEVDRLVRAG